MADIIQKVLLLDQNIAGENRQWEKTSRQWEFSKNRYSEKNGLLEKNQSELVETGKALERVHGWLEKILPEKNCRKSSP